MVAGNAPLADTVRNAARLVAVRRPARPPRIALGAAVPLRRPLVTAPHDQHGSDGLGDAPGWPPLASPPASPSAAETLVALARGYMHLHDPLAVGLAVDASLARWQPARIVVGESGQTRRAAGAPNCRVAHVIDVERVLALFFDRLCHTSS